MNKVLVLISVIALFCLVVGINIIQHNHNKVFSCDKLSLGAVYLKPSEKPLASKIVDREGVVSIPSEKIILSKTDALDCKEYNLKEYQIGW